MTAHLYWRINVTANDGDPRYLAIAEMEMRATVGGADQCVGGVANASSITSGFEADKAFDNNSETRWSPPPGTTTGWLSYQFTTPVEVVEYTIQAHPVEGDRSPRNWTLEYSDDGSTWVAVDSRDGVTGWTNGEIRTFDVPTAGTIARVSQVGVRVVSQVDPDARVAQLALRVVSQADPDARITQLALRVVSTNVPDDPPDTGGSQRPILCVIC